MAHPDCYTLDNSKLLNNGHYEITSDPYGHRNGDIFKVFHDREEIIKTFSEFFADTCIGMQDEDYYGMHIQMWMVVMKKTAYEARENLGTSMYDFFNEAIGLAAKKMINEARENE